MPNVRGRRFTNAHETMIWAAKDKDARYTFNYDAMKRLNDDLQMRSDWLIPIGSGGERLKNGQAEKGHPTQKPKALLPSVSKTTTNPGSTWLGTVFEYVSTVTVATQISTKQHSWGRDPHKTNHPKPHQQYKKQ